MFDLNIEIFDQRIFSFYIWEKLIYNSNKNKNKVPHTTITVGVDGLQNPVVGDIQRDIASFRH